MRRLVTAYLNARKEKRKEALELSQKLQALRNETESVQICMNQFQELATTHLITNGEPDLAVQVDEVASRFFEEVMRDPVITAGFDIHQTGVNKYRVTLKEIL